MIENKLRVAIQGIATSFHEVAAIKYFNKPFTSVECMTFHSLCEALQNNNADFAVMAIENSIAGSILPNYFLLQEYHFEIVGELYLPIHMHLLALPGVNIQDIKIVESHPMAIRQCSDFLNRMLPLEIKESEDTALSAKNIKEKNSKHTATLGNELTAKKYGLNILERRIETHKKNFTRFLILSKKENKKADSDKASISFEVSNEVGSLAKVLTLFSQKDINLSKIQSIPIIGKPNEYSIHVDLEWSNRVNYDQAINQILRLTKNLNVLGEYKKGKINY